MLVLIAVVVMMVPPTYRSCLWSLASRYYSGLIQKAAKRLRLAFCDQPNLWNPIDGGKACTIANHPNHHFLGKIVGTITAMHERHVRFDSVTYLSRQIQRHTASSGSPVCSCTLINDDGITWFLCKHTDSACDEALHEIREAELRAWKSNMLDISYRRRWALKCLPLTEYVPKTALRALHRHFRTYKGVREGSISDSVSLYFTTQPFDPSTPRLLGTSTTSLHNIS